MAIMSLEEARKNWRKVNSHLNQTMLEPRLRPELELYFEMSLGSVYESSGKDDMALGCYMRAR